MRPICYNVLATAAACPRRCLYHLILNGEKQAMQKKLAKRIGTLAAALAVCALCAAPAYAQDVVVEVPGLPLEVTLDGSVDVVTRETPADAPVFAELGLELSCPEAAKLILNAPLAPLMVDTRPDGGTPGYDVEAMASLKASREVMLSILSDESHSVGESLALGLLYGCQAQSELDGGEESPFDAGAALETAAALAKPGNPADVLDFFLGLELLTPQWETMLRHPDPGNWTQHHRALARYLTQRYWLQAVSDYDLYCRVKFILISCLLVRLVGGDIFSTAQLYSKEVENDTDNVEAILDAAYAHPAFTDDKLLGMLLSRSL